MEKIEEERKRESSLVLSLSNVTPSPSAQFSLRRPNYLNASNRLTGCSLCIRYIIFSRLTRFACLRFREYEKQPALHALETDPEKWKNNNNDNDDDGFSVYFTFNMILLSITLTALWRQVNGSSLEQIAERSENGYFPNVWNRITEHHIQSFLLSNDSLQSRVGLNNPGVAPRSFNTSDPKEGLTAKTLPPTL